MKATFASAPQMLQRVVSHLSRVSMNQRHSAFCNSNVAIFSLEIKSYVKKQKPLWLVRFTSIDLCSWGFSRVNELNLMQPRAPKDMTDSATERHCWPGWGSLQARPVESEICVDSVLVLTVDVFASQIWRILWRWRYCWPGWGSFQARPRGIELFLIVFQTMEASDAVWDHHIASKFFNSEYQVHACCFCMSNFDFLLAWLCTHRFGAVWMLLAWVSYAYY